MLADLHVQGFDLSHQQLIAPGSAAGSASMSKVSRYGWNTLDEPGELIFLDKSQLLVDRSYQRVEEKVKTTDIASKFSWKAFGAISVMQRSDGKYLVVDGQHRALAAWKRADVYSVPCILFRSSGIEDEATCFINANTKRKSVSAFSKFRAKLVARDEMALLLDSILRDVGLVPSAESKGVDRISCVAKCEKMLKQHLASFKKSISIAADISRSDQTYVSDILVSGLFYLDRHIPGGLENRKVAQRLTQIGALGLIESARKMTYRTGCGGQKSYAEGMLEIINRSMRGKVSFRN